MARTCDIGKLTADETLEHMSELWNVLDDEHRLEFMEEHDLGFKSEMEAGT